MRSPYWLTEWSALAHTPVESSNVASVAYSPSFGRLYVEFKAPPFPQRGQSSLYVYFDVPPSVYADMLVAPSKGQYVWRVLRGGGTVGYGYAKVY